VKSESTSVNEIWQQPDPEHKKRLLRYKNGCSNGRQRLTLEALPRSSILNQLLGPMDAFN
jgi:hypothetical protein